ncbi:MAG: hypothetical protein ACKOEX_00415 [Planctomycetia bacterium]
MMHAANSTRDAHDRWWRDHRSWSLAAIGLVLVASGCAHLAVWAVLGGPWDGPITWRKPILFGISGGVTAISLGWAWSHVPFRRGDTWLAAATAWTLLIEVLLIDLQRWRGVASHFNRETGLDSLLYDLMGGLILFVTAVIVDLTIRFAWQRADVTGDMLLAARAGLLFLAISCVLGIWASVHGDVRAAAGLPPETFGAAGVTKFPHGMALHAIQWLPMLAWASRRAGLADRVRWRLVAVATVGTALLLAYALAQTLEGRARFDAPPAIAAVFAIGIACLAVPVIVTALSWTTSSRDI